MPDLRDTYDLFVDGASIPAEDGATFETLDPANGERLAAVAAAGEADVDAAVASARRGFEAWQALTPPERGRRLHAVASALRDHREELARIETLDQGKPISSARGSIDVAARYFEYYAGAADKIHGETIQLDGSWNAKTIREPYGVSVQVTPWNYPITQLARGVAPALAAGNATVVKPAEQTPLSSLRVAELASAAGLPDGVLNVVSGFGVPAGEHLVGHDDVDVVTFTGSVETGQRVMEQAARGVKQTTLELGGKSPAVVFPDADFDAALDGVLDGIFGNAGQTCNASARLLVHESCRDEFVDALVDRAEAYTVGPGLDDPDMGPLVSEAHLEKVSRYLDLGRREGATVRTGGDVIDRAGYFVEPTVFVDVEPDMRIAQEEIFGPVLTVFSFADEAEAVELANDSTYGLVAGLFTGDYDRVNRLSQAIEAGHVYVNEWFAGGVETPFGGVKRSGIGREKGLQAVEHYTRTKTVSSRSFRGGPRETPDDGE